MALDIVDNLPPTLAFVEVDTNTIQLAGDVTSIGSGGVNAVLGGHDLRNETTMNHGHWRDDKKKVSYIARENQLLDIIKDFVLPPHHTRSTTCRLEMDGCTLQRRCQPPFSRFSFLDENHRQSDPINGNASPKSKHTSQNLAPIWLPHCPAWM